MFSIFLYTPRYISVWRLNTRTSIHYAIQFNISTNYILQKDHAVKYYNLHYGRNFCLTVVLDRCAEKTGN